ncbi:hypothetical protein GN956_G13193 [Arapaima gigas]
MDSRIKAAVSSSDLLRAVRASRKGRCPSVCGDSFGVSPSAASQALALRGEQQRGMGLPLPGSTQTGLQNSPAETSPKQFGHVFPLNFPALSRPTLDEFRNECGNFRCLRISSTCGVSLLCSIRGSDALGRKRRPHLLPRFCQPLEKTETQRCGTGEVQLMRTPQPGPYPPANLLKAARGDREVSAAAQDQRHGLSLTMALPEKSRTHMCVHTHTHAARLFNVQMGNSSSNTDAD